MFTYRRRLPFFSIVLILTLLFSALPPASAQGPDGIERQVNTQTGKVSFIGPENGEVLTAADALGMADIRPQDPAMALAKRFGPEFGLRDPQQELSELKRDQADSGRLTVRYQQNYQGIPVMGGELIVNTNENGDLYSLNGEVSPDLSLSTQPVITSEQARQSALASVAKWYGKTLEDFTASGPALWIYDESLLRPSTRPAELVWRMEVTPKDADMPVRELVLVNAQRGGISLHFNQVDTAWNISERKDSKASYSNTSGMPALLGATWYVATTGSDAQSCSSAGNPCQTINAAINKAASGDVIKIAIGMYMGAGAEVVLIHKSVNLSGGWSTGFTTQNGHSTIDGKSERRGVTVTSDVTAVIERLVVENGSASHGGGIFNSPGGVLTVNHSIIRGNVATGGGGGGIYNHIETTLTLNHSAVHANDGSGIHNHGALILNNSTVSNHTNSGIFNSTGAIFGGSRAQLTMNNSTISGNTGLGAGGGGLLNEAATAILNSSTVSGNKTTYGPGGGIYNITGSGGTVTLRNTIIAGNSAKSSAPDCAGPITSNGYNLIGNGSGCTFTASIGDLTNINPNLGVLIGMPGYHPLMTGSPAINAGNPAGCMGSAGALNTDQRGASRVGICDIGAYEYTAPGSASRLWILSGNDQNMAPRLPFLLPFQAVAFDNQGTPVPGVSITFTAPATGASGIFAGTGNGTIAVSTNANGIATSPAFTANANLGAYTITASANGAGSINFSLQNFALYVSPTGSDGNSCLLPSVPCNTIQGAIKKATKGNSILLATGAYTGTDYVVVNIDRDINLFGGWDTAFTSQSGQSTINGQSERGGVIVNGGMTVIMDRFVVEEGYSSDGSGISNGGTLILNNSLVRNNTCCSNPSSNGGGGIGNYGRLTVNNSTIANNYAHVPGYSFRGGGIFSYEGIVILNNSTVSGNVADGGGGVFSFSTVVLNNSTITRNTGSVFGGGIFFDRDYLGNPNYAITLQNTLVADNLAGSAPDCMGPITSAGYNLLGNNSGCTFTPAAGDQVGTQASPVRPVLTPLQGKSPAPLTHALMAGSPAINAGNPASPGSGGSACLATDQRGVSRPVDVRCDIGAFEYQGNGTVPAQIFAYSGTPQFIQPGSPAASVLKALVLDADGDTVPGKAVTFTAPSSGPSAVFASTGTNTATVLTDAYGIAASPAFSTNSLHGGYTIKATVAGVAEAANFEILTFTQHVKTYTANGNATLPGTLLCDQTKPTCTNNINPHADAAHKYAMGTNTFYATQHERDSIDDQGMTIISTVHYEVGYDNAFWNGEQMVYGDAFGFALADDVVAHELTHGVTQYESNLFYYYQSGAINESFSDLWGEFYDQVNTQGNDAANVKWQIGEDVSGLGILRSMSTPPVYNDPDRMSSSYYYEGDEDNGGVHTNSGVNNKAVYLMVDGGNFNSKTVTALGWTKTAAIYYEAQTKLLSSGADYSDLYYALQQACKNLIGQKGISAVDCAEVKDALDAVEMNAQPATNFNTDAPLCDAGSAPNFVFSDDLEAGTSNWTFSNGTNLRWQVDSPLGPFAQSGLHSLYADDDPAKVTDAIARLKPIAIPANAYLHFAHAYDFESGYNTGDPTFYNFDGGVLEYSINNSSTWVDAGSLINFNGYKGTLFTGAGNPLSGRSAFVGASHGYISSRVDLAPLAGKAVIFRWRMGLDEAGLALGWWVDNVRLYTCIPFPGAFNKTAPANGSTGVGLTTTLAWSSSAYATSYQYCYDTIDDNQCNRTWNGGPSTTAGISNLGPNTTYYWQVRAANQVGGIDADNQTWGSFTTTSTLPPGATGVKTYIGVDQKGSYSLASGQSLRESYTGANNGPVKILSTSSTPLIGAERVVYKVNGVNTSFSELMGLPDSQLDNIYWLPWYNNTGDLDTQLRFANVSASTATVHVYIGGAEMSGSPFTLLSGESTRESFAGISNGPVKIESDVPIVAAERVVYKVAGVNTSFSEMMALPNSHLDTTYWLPWYNNVELDTQLRFANVSNSSATVRVYIGGAEMSGSPFTLGVGESTRKSFPGINNGPVKIESDVPIVAAERVVYKAAGLNTSFMEMMGLPAGQLDTTYWLPWYNNRDFDTQLRFANVSDTPATVHIYIGGVEMTGSPFTLEPDASTRQSFAGINNGPVQIVSDVPIVAAERLVFKVNGLGTSFFEMMALPNSQLDTTYWLPWYNNVELDTQLRFGIP